MEKSIVAIILAGGLGTRMESDIPKVLHKINGIPMIIYILKNLINLNKLIHVKKILIVVGKYRENIQKEIEKYINLSSIIYVNQPEPLGTGHAVNCCIDELIKYPDTNTLILSGDVPFFSINSIIKLTENVLLARIVAMEMINPEGYGRIVIKNNKFEKIVEHNDCDPIELGVKKVNCGIYCINTECLIKWLPSIKNDNAKGEYYLTDVIKIIKDEEKQDIEIYEIGYSDSYEVMGVNNKQQLFELEIIMKNLLQLTIT